MSRRSLQHTDRSHSQRRAVTIQVTDFLKKQYPTKIPIASITAISKLYAQKKPVSRETKLIKRVSETQTLMNTARFLQYISTDTHYEKGRQLQDDHIKRIYQGHCNSDGKLSFQYIMKLGQNAGIHVPQKTAKAIVKKYGKRKDFLNLDDCLRVIKGRYQKIGRKLSPKQSPSLTPRNMRM